MKKIVKCSCLNKAFVQTQSSGLKVLYLHQGRGFIKGQAPSKLTSCEDGFAQLLSASLQLKIVKIFKVFL